jgi:hypothetical protein
MVYLTPLTIQYRVIHPLRLVIAVLDYWMLVLLTWSTNLSPNEFELEAVHRVPVGRCRAGSRQWQAACLSRLGTRPIACRPSQRHRRSRRRPQPSNPTLSSDLDRRCPPNRTGLSSWGLPAGAGASCAVAAACRSANSSRFAATAFTSYSMSLTQDTNGRRWPTRS